MNEIREIIYISIKSIHFPSFLISRILLSIFLSLSFSSAYSFFLYIYIYNLHTFFLPSKWPLGRRPSQHPSKKLAPFSTSSRQGIKRSLNQTKRAESWICTGKSWHVATKMFKLCGLFSTSPNPQTAIYPLQPDSPSSVKNPTAPIS